MEPRTIFFIGKPGCGKGTQSALLAKQTSWPIVAAGEQFRAIAREDSLLGRKVKRTIDAGILTPHWFPMYLYLKSLFAISEESSVIFDGFNRKVPEAELIIDSLQWIERPFTVFHLKVSDDEVRRRLAIRKDIEGRVDDDVVDRRLEEYYANTEATLSLFEKAGVLVELNGEETPDEVATAIRSHLKI
jgi:adenylate kinase